MAIKLGVLMDPIQSIHVKKDTTLALLLAAQKQGLEIFYFEQNDLFLQDGKVLARLKKLKVFDDEKHWYEFSSERITALTELDVILMRKDPPFNIEYVFTTHLLEIAESQGVLVVNKPQSLRDANEKLYTAYFPQCCPPTLVARDKAQFKQFIAQHNDVVLKPLFAMGGASVFRVKKDDPNLNVIIETLTEHETKFIMAQCYIPEIKEGDKRILLIDGKPFPYALARIAAEGETRANLAAGGTGKGVALSKRDLWICEQVGETLRNKGLLFVGLDVIGDYLTEINVTSPTCIRELEAIYKISIAEQVIEAITVALSSRKTRSVYPGSRKS